MRVGSTYKQKDSTSDTLMLKGQKKIDQELRNTLTADDGMFRPGALPQVDGSTSAGSKQLLDTLEKARGDTMVW